MDTAEGSLSNSSTSTSLDTALIDSTNEARRNTSPPKSQAPHPSFTPILETEENNQKSGDKLKISSLKSGGDTKTSKSSLKSSKVSFEKADYSSDEDSFEDRRDHFQQRKAKSVDHKGILKVIFFYSIFIKTAGSIGCILFVRI